MNTLEENKPMVKNMATSLGENTPYSLIPRFSNFGSGEDEGYFKWSFRPLVQIQYPRPFMRGLAQMVEQKHKAPFRLFPASNISDGEGASYFLLRRAKSLAEYRLFLGNKIKEV